MKKEVDRSSLYLVYGYLFGLSKSERVSKDIRDEISQLARIIGTYLKELDDFVPLIISEDLKKDRQG